MAKRRVRAKFVLKNANKCQFYVRMGSKKIDALNAKKSLYAHIANADISAKNVGGRLIVSMGVSGSIAGTAAGSPYVCINSRSKHAMSAVRDVLMAKRAVDAIFVS